MKKDPDYRFYKFMTDGELQRKYDQLVRSCEIDGGSQAEFNLMIRQRERILSEQLRRRGGGTRWDR